PPPERSMTPSAAYCAPVNRAAASMIRSRTPSRESSELIAMPVSTSARTRSVSRAVAIILNADTTASSIPVTLLTGVTSFSADEARRVGEEIGIDWSSAPFDIEQFRIGMDVELEHGIHDPITNVPHDDPLVTGKIALAHLNEFPDYYTRL